MSRFAIRHRSAAALALALPLSAALAVAGTSAVGAQAASAHPAKSSTRWTRISKNTGLGIASPGLFRTADGRLHVIWPSEDSPNVFGLHYSTVGGQSKLLATGTVVSHWASIAMFPRLLPGKNGGLQLLLDGANGVASSPYNTGAMYLATSNAAGKSWTLAHGSLAHTGFVPLTDTAGATESNGTPVAAWKGGPALDYHVGLDPNSPATSPDQQLGIGPGGFLIDPTLVRSSTGAIVAGWFNSSGDAHEGYWAAQILPSKGAKMKAPNSGSRNQTNGQPEQPVALVAHPGGGSYMAYCVPTHTLHCSHIALWRVGAARTLTVPGSTTATGAANFVTLTAGHAGHLWISWFNTSTSKISVVRTNTAVTKFGQVRTINAPGPLFDFLGLSALGGSGPLDLIALAAVSQANPAYYDTELFPALRIHASTARVSNLHSTTITFTVDDSGDAVPSVTVKFLGKSAKTNSKGAVKFTVPKGTARGKHLVVASKSGYASATFTVRVT